MPTIQLIDYEASARCQTVNLSCRDAFPPITCTFEGGRVYGLHSDIRCGSWALSWALGGRAKEAFGEILLDGVHAAPKDLASLACFIGEPYFPGLNSRLFPGTVGSCLNKALDAGQTGWTLQQLTKAFCLTPERFERSPVHVHYAQSWFLSAAVGFASGKEIFCFPYLPVDTLRAVDVMCREGIFDLLREYGKIVLLPSVHQDRLDPVCDQVIDVVSAASTLG